MFTTLGVLTLLSGVKGVLWGGDVKEGVCALEGREGDIYQVSAMCQDEAGWMFNLYYILIWF